LICFDIEAKYFAVHFSYRAQRNTKLLTRWQWTITTTNLIPLGEIFAANSP